MTENQTSREDRYNHFVSLLTRNDQSIRRFVRSLLPSPQDVDDVVQDTALECWRKFSDYESGGAEKQPDEFIRWACVIARYKVLSRQRDLSRDRLVFRENVVAQLADSALDQIDQRESELRWVDECLAELDSELRRLLLSVYRQGDSIARIAKETDQQARRLYTKLNGLRKILLQCVERKMVEES